MPIRLTGPRALIEPILPAPRSDLIELTDRAIPQAGIVRQIGRAICPECGGVGAYPDIHVNDRVFVPATVGQEIEMDGRVWWVVDLADLTAAWEREA